MAIELNPDNFGWETEASCAKSSLQFDGFPEFSKRRNILTDSAILAAKNVCRDCVVLEQCREQVQETPRYYRNIGAVQGGLYIGSEGALFELMNRS